MKTEGRYNYPETFERQRILGYSPYIMMGDLTIAANQPAAVQFQAGPFLNSLDMPFLVTRMKPAVISLDGSGLDQADPSIGSLLHLVFLTVKLLSRSRDMTQAPTRIITMLDADTGIWEFDRPVILKQKDGFIVFGQNLVPVANAAGGVRIELSFMGSLLDLER